MSLKLIKSCPRLSPYPRKKYSRVQISSFVESWVYKPSSTPLAFNSLRLMSTTMAQSGGQRRFAPLKKSVASTDPVLRGVVFDVDGTLCKPQTYMFAEMRSALGITKATDILDHVYSLPTPEAQHEAMEKIRNIERSAMATQEPQPGLSELMAYLDLRGVPKAICTRNFDAPVAHLLEKFLAGSEFGPIVTRDFRPPKPHPAGILHIARSWGLTVPADPRAPTDEVAAVGESAGAAGEVAVEEKRAVESAVGGEVDGVADASGLIMVGDSIDDMTAGRRAGAATVLLVNDVNEHLSGHEDTDLVVSRLDDLIEVLEKGFQSRAL